MLLTDDKEKIDYLVKAKKKFLKEYHTLDGFKAEKKRTKEFVDSFNKEAKKQNSKWYAKTEEHKSIADGRPFILTHLCKETKSGWWIFKVSNITELHICVYENHACFVENDYVIVDGDIKRNDKIFHYLPELKSILEKIPQAFFILPKEEIFDYDKVVAGIKKDIEEIKEVYLNGR